MIQNCGLVLIVALAVSPVAWAAQFAGFVEKTESDRLKSLAAYISKLNHYPTEQFYLARYVESQFQCNGKTLFVLTYADVLNVDPNPAMAPPCEEKGCRIHILVEEGKEYKPLFTEALIDFKGVDPSTIKLECPDLLVHLHGSHKANNPDNRYIRGRLKFVDGNFKLIPEPNQPL